MSEINGSAPGPNVVQVQQSRAEAVMGEIEAALASVQDISAMIQQLLADIKAHQATRPQAPNTDGMDEEDASTTQQKFQQDLARWEEGLMQLTKQLEAAQVKLGEADRKLQRLQNQDLPTAQQEDIRAAREEAEAAAAAAKEAISGLDDTNEDKSDVRRAQRRARVVTVQTGEGPVQVAVLGIVRDTSPKPTVGTSHIPSPGGSGLPVGDM